MARYALPTNLNFLFQRVDQIRPLLQPDIPRRATWPDLFDKDPLFARSTSSDDEFALLRKIYTYLKPQTPTPDLVIICEAGSTLSAVGAPRRRDGTGISETYWRGWPTVMPGSSTSTMRGAAARRQQRPVELRRQPRPPAPAAAASRHDARAAEFFNVAGRSGGSTPAATTPARSPPAPAPLASAGAVRRNPRISSR
jgi:hypothetical protein